MPKVKPELRKLKHPNSRKTQALLKQIKKSENRKKSKLAQHIKQNVIGERVAWFRDHLDKKPGFNPADIEELINKYLARFDDELAQIAIKHSIGNRKNRQHANREDIIKLTINREREEYNTCGIEIPELLCHKELEKLKNWNGELRLLQNLKFCRMKKKI